MRLLAGGEGHFPGASIGDGRGHFLIANADRYCGVWRTSTEDADGLFALQDHMITEWLGKIEGLQTAGDEDQEDKEDKSR